MKASDYFDQLEDHLSEGRDAGIASQQARYMKNQFDFLGLKAGPLRERLRSFYKVFGYPAPDQLSQFSRLCWKSPYRELQYSALETIKRQLKHQPEAFIRELEWMVVNKSWWDTVDWLAGLIGAHLERYPDLQPATTDAHNTSENMWLNRVSIIFQLKYGKRTDFEMLSRYILRHRDSKEFFIRKAQGWALRQHSKQNAEQVRAFVQSHPELSGLALREASKYL